MFANYYSQNNLKIPSRHVLRHSIIEKYRIFIQKFNCWTQEVSQFTEQFILYNICII